jgi:hypothetical protein
MSWSSAMTTLIVLCGFAVCPTSQRKTTASRYLSGRFGNFKRQVCYGVAKLSKVRKKQYSQAGTIRINFSYLEERPWTRDALKFPRRVSEIIGFITGLKQTALNSTNALTSEGTRWPKLMSRIYGNGSEK